MEIQKKIGKGQLILGALLKFEKVTILDLEILSRMLNDLGISVDLSSKMRFICYTGRFLSIKNDDTVTLAKDRSLSDIIEDGESIEEKFRKLCGIESFFDNFDRDEYERLKNDILEKEKNRFLTRSIVLLISTENEDLNALKRYGFKRIDHFKSVITASEYFKEHPEELVKYDMLVQGRQTLLIDESSRRLEFKKKIEEAKGGKPVLNVTLYNHTDTYDASVNNFSYWRNWLFSEKTYSELLDRIMEAIIANRCNDMLDVSKHFIPIDKTSLPFSLAPHLKKNLRILYLDDNLDLEGTREVADELGLNVTFETDSLETREKYYPILGSYDIVIASTMCSPNLTFDNAEQCELCEKSGLEHQLLVTYRTTPISLLKNYRMYDPQGIGMAIALRYLQAGSKMELKGSKELTFKVLNDSSAQEGYCDKVNRKREESLKIILKTAVQLYSEELNPILDLDYKDYRTYTPEYEEAFRRAKEKEDTKLRALKVFDDFKSCAEKCLSFIGHGEDRCLVGNYLIRRVSSGIRITPLDGIYEVRTIILKDGEGDRYSRTFVIEKEGSSKTVVLGKYGELNSASESEYLKKIEDFVLMYKKVAELSEPFIIGKPVDRELVPQKEDKKSPGKVTSQEELKKAETSSIIDMLNGIRKTTTKYLLGVNQGKIYRDPEGVSVSYNKSEIKITISVNKQFICGLVLPREDESKGEKTFQLQLRTKKGTISNPQKLTVSRKEALKLDGKQMEAIRSIHKKVNYSIKPLIEDAEKKGRRISFTKKEN